MRFTVQDGRHAHRDISIVREMRANPLGNQVSRSITKIAGQIKNPPQQAGWHLLAQMSAQNDRAQLSNLHFAISQLLAGVKSLTHSI
jgi:hypothetical protein